MGSAPAEGLDPAGLAPDNRTPSRMFSVPLSCRNWPFPTNSVYRRRWSGGPRTCNACADAQTLFPSKNSPSFPWKACRDSWWTTRLRTCRSWLLSGRTSSCRGPLRPARRFLSRPSGINPGTALACCPGYTSCSVRFGWAGGHRRNVNRIRGGGGGDNREYGASRRVYDSGNRKKRRRRCTDTHGALSDPVLPGKTGDTFGNIL